MENPGGAGGEGAEEAALAPAAGPLPPRVPGRPQEQSGGGGQGGHGGRDGAHLRPPQSRAHHGTRPRKDAQERPGPESVRAALRTTR